MGTMPIQAACCPSALVSPRRAISASHTARFSCPRSYRAWADLILPSAALTSAPVGILARGGGVETLRAPGSAAAAASSVTPTAALDETGEWERERERERERDDERRAAAFWTISA